MLIPPIKQRVVVCVMSQTAVLTVVASAEIARQESRILTWRGGSTPWGSRTEGSSRFGQPVCVSLALGSFER